MRYFFLLLFIFTLSLINLQAQVVGGSIEKLAKLYNQAKFESCLYKAEDYTFKEDYKRDPEPYIYMAMCFYELSNSTDEFIKEDYKNGLKLAIKNTAKFIKYDKEGVFYSDNIDFVNTLKNSQFKITKDYFNEEKYKKSGLASKQYSRLVKGTDYSMIYFRGVCEILSNNISVGTRSLNEAIKGLNTQIKDGNLSIDNRFKTLVVTSFLEYSEYLVNDKRNNDALKTLTLAKKIFPNNGYIDIQYNMIKKQVDKK
jgi:hypothetical protein